MHSNNTPPHLLRQLLLRVLSQTTTISIAQQQQRELQQQLIEQQQHLQQQREQLQREQLQREQLQQQQREQQQQQLQQQLLQQLMEEKKKKGRKTTEESARDLKDYHFSSRFTQGLSSDTVGSRIPPNFSSNSFIGPYF